jgi:hypothetical protein
LIFQASIGRNVANKNDINSKDCDMNKGKTSLEKRIPINIDLEKSGLGNNNKPAVKPIIIDI